MHLQVCRGQVANRILSVGDAGRAGRLAVALFDDGKYALHNSSRGFAVYTGMYKDVPVSIIATGMVRRIHSCCNSCCSKAHGLTGLALKPRDIRQVCKCCQSS